MVRGECAYKSSIVLSAAVGTGQALLNASWYDITLQTVNGLSLSSAFHRIQYTFMNTKE